MARKRRPNLSRASILDIASELQRRRAALPEMLARRSELAAELAQIESAISALGGVVSKGKAGRRGGGGAAKARRGAGAKRAKNDANLSESLVKVLTGKTMSVTEAAGAVVKAGYKTTSSNFRTMVNIALLNKKRFKRVDRGQYTAA